MSEIACFRQLTYVGQNVVGNKVSTMNKLNFCAEYSERSDGELLQSEIALREVLGLTFHSFEATIPVNFSS